MIGVSSIQEGLLLLKENHGRVTLLAATTPDGGWAVAIVTGQEAEDSPMAGGAAHGQQPDLDGAIKQAFKDYQIDLVVDTEREVR